MILVEAPGFRPTAVDAPLPIKPTPIAAPRAARPTVILPVISVVLSSVPRSCLVTRRSVRHCRYRRRVLLVLTNEEGEHRGQQHEDQRLHQTDEQLHEIEGNR